MSNHVFADPIVQYGFAGMSAVLVVMICWLARRLMDLLEKTSAIISANTDAIRTLTRRSEENARLYADLRDRLLSRPCLSMQDE
jgi:hypothetical protein